MKKIILAMMLSVVCVVPLYAGKTTVDLGGKVLQTNYPNCQPYIDGIVKLIGVLSEKPDMEDLILPKIELFAKLLKRCNKAKGVGFEGSIDFSHEFD